MSQDSVPSTRDRLAPGKGATMGEVSTTHQGCHSRSMSCAQAVLTSAMYMTPSSDGARVAGLHHHDIDIQHRPMDTISKFRMLVSTVSYHHLCMRRVRVRSTRDPHADPAGHSTTDSCPIFKRSSASPSTPPHILTWHGTSIFLFVPGKWSSTCQGYRIF